MDFSFIFAQVGGVCTAPNPFQWAAIIALISGAGVVTITTGTALISIATTIVTMLVAGASISAIIEAISGQAIASTGGVEILVTLINAIMSILGC